MSAILFHFVVKILAIFYLQEFLATEGQISAPYVLFKRESITLIDRIHESDILQNNL